MAGSRFAEPWEPSPSSNSASVLELAISSVPPAAGFCCALDDVPPPPVRGTNRCGKAIRSSSKGSH
jgi:hypothetical protein